MRVVLIFFLASLLYIGSVFWATQGKTFRADSDYDSNLPIVAYVVDTIRNEHRFPFWNPYVSTGISVLGDPLSAVTYLPYLLPMLLIGVSQGLWVVIWFHNLLAGFFMWMLLRLLKINTGSAVWGALLYMGAGAFAARVASGHIEKMLSYPWYPLLLMLLLKKKQSTKTAGAIGAVMGVVFLTGDVYGLLFMMIFYGVIGVISPTSSRWAGLRGVKGIGVAMAAFVVVGAVKLVPFLWEVATVMSRYSSFDAARGSIPVWLVWLPFVMPAGVSFYDRPILQRLFGFWYNWYEYYAFIGLPMVFLLWVPRIIKRRETQLLLIFLAVGLAFVARGHVSSPFFGLAPLFESIRAPQRMIVPLTSVVVALIVLCAQEWMKPKHALLWGMLISTFIVSGYQMTHAFEPPRTCCTQLHLIRDKVPMIHYYYGWIPKPLWENQNSP